MQARSSSPQSVKEEIKVRHDWQLSEVKSLFELPLMTLLYRAATMHRCFFNPEEIQLSTLLSIKTGACPEDCGYCSQSGHYQTGLKKEKLLSISQVQQAAQAAKAQGATRFCMGAAWRSPRAKDMPHVLAMVREVKALGLETCMTLGMLTLEQARALAEEGLDYYNHNLDTSRAYYKKVVTTRTYEDRLTTLAHVREAGIRVCTGGIVGMGESRDDRAALLQTLANLPQHPESVPINLLVKVPGTPLAQTEVLDPFEFVRTVAVARVLMPAAWVRLSAGREQMEESLQALCFFAGANSIFSGERLLTTKHITPSKDARLFARLGMRTIRGK